MYQLSAVKKPGCADIPNGQSPIIDPCLYGFCQSFKHTRLAGWRFVGLHTSFGLQMHRQRLRGKSAPRGAVRGKFRVTASLGVVFCSDRDAMTDHGPLKFVADTQTKGVATTPAQLSRPDFSVRIWNSRAVLQPMWMSTLGIKGAPCTMSCKAVPGFWYESAWKVRGSLPCVGPWKDRALHSWRKAGERRWRRSRYINAVCPAASFFQAHGVLYKFPRQLFRLLSCERWWLEFDNLSNFGCLVRSWPTKRPTKWTAYPRWIPSTRGHRNMRRLDEMPFRRGK